RQSANCEPSGPGRLRRHPCVVGRPGAGPSCRGNSMQSRHNDPSDNALAARHQVRPVSISEIYDHLPNLLNEPAHLIRIKGFGDEWDTVAREALEVMAQGRDLLVTESFLSDPGRRPLPILPFLEGLTRFFCREAHYRDIPLEPVKLWEFVG